MQKFLQIFCSQCARTEMVFNHRSLLSNYLSLMTLTLLKIFEQYLLVLFCYKPMVPQYSKMLNISLEIHNSFI